MSCRLAKRDENGNLELDCNDIAYFRTMESEIPKLVREGNKQRLSDFAKELHNFKLLCGSSPVLQRFEEAIKRASRALNMGSCKIVQRSLEQTPKQKAESKRRFTMRGFETYEITKNGLILQNKPKPQPHIERVLSDVEIALARSTDVARKPKDVNRSAEPFTNSKKKPFVSNRKWL